jgi:hypothetical protein
MNPVTEFLAYVLSLTLVLMMFFVLQSLMKFLKTKTTLNEVNVFQSFATVAESVIETAVIETNQTLVNTLKDCNGNLDKSESLDAYNKTLTRVQTVLGPQILAILGEHLDDVGEWIESHIERYVALHKKEIPIVSDEELEKFFKEFNTEDEETDDDVTEAPASITIEKQSIVPIRDPAITMVSDSIEVTPLVEAASVTEDSSASPVEEVSTDDKTT